MQRIMHISETHEAWLPEENFPLVAMIDRFPRYVNKRVMDPHLKCFVDENGYEIPPEWGIPKPNPEAAYKSLAKYGKDIPSMEEYQVEAMNAAWSYTARQFGVYMCDSEIITLEESIAKMNMSSSSGAPFNQLYKTKRELFEQDSQIREWLEKDWETMAVDPNWSCLFTNSLKEELRTDEKIMENSQRTFLAGGTDATIHGTRLFSDMNEKMYASHIQTSSAIGVSPYKGNWDRLYQKLAIFSKGYALDESQYDSSLRTYMMWGCALFRWNMLKPDLQTEANLNRLRTYYRNLVHTLVITPEGVIVMKRTGNPSGSVNTISDNTLILYTLLAYAWILSTPENMRTYEHFEMHTSKALVGDDNTWTVSEEAHPYYNAHTVIAHWKVIGVTTTTDSMEPRHPRELDFLSAHTVFLDGLAVPIYSRVKMMTTLLYAPKNHHTPATTLQRVAALLSVGWIDVTFRKFCRHAIAWLLSQYDDVMCDEPTWILAKCQILTDAHYYRLFTGQRQYFVLKPQSFYLEGPVKLTQPNKKEMSTARARTNGTKPGKKTIRRRGPRKPRAQRVRVVAIPRKGRKPRTRKNKTLAAQGPSNTGMRSRKTCTVVEDEFIAPVVGSVAFAVTSYAINPGNATTFPWLSQQAKQWEKYHFNYLQFYYKRVVSEFATNGTTGKVMMNVDFDANDPPPSTKQQIEDSDPRVDGMPCENISLPLRANQLHSLTPMLYVRSAGLPGNADIKTFDAGNFNLATQGNQNTSEIGELRVKYSVSFVNPVLEATTVAPRNYNVSSYRTASTSLTSTLGAIVANGTEMANGIGTVNAAGFITLPAGNYLITASTKFTFGGLATQVSMNIQKNGVSLLTTANPQLTFVSGQLTVASLTEVGYISSNGTDTVAVRVVATFSTSTGDVTGNIVIQSV